MATEIDDLRIRLREAEELLREAFAADDAIATMKNGDSASALLHRSNRAFAALRKAVESAPADCPRRMEGGPCRFVKGAPGEPEWCYYCERVKPVESAPAPTRRPARPAGDDAIHAAFNEPDGGMFVSFRDGWRASEKYHAIAPTSERDTGEEGEK